MSKERELLHRLGNVIYIAKKAKLSVIEIICHLQGLVEEFKKEKYVKNIIKRNIKRRKNNETFN